MTWRAALAVSWLVALSACSITVHHQVVTEIHDATVSLNLRLCPPDGL